MTLLAIAASLLVAAAQGPGTIEPAIAARPTDPPQGIGDSAVRQAVATPRPASRPSASLEPVATGPTSKDPERLKGYHWPIARSARITSFFDFRDTGFLSVGGKRIHEGLDVTTFCGDEVFAAHSGTVLAAGRRFGPAMGFNAPLDDFYKRLERKGSMNDLPVAVVIDDGNGYRSAYVHLQEASVKPGQKVRAGQVVGLQGDTGNASGCHLHYELFRMDGRWMQVARERVKEDRYPTAVRERIDPLRVLSLRDKAAPRTIPGLVRPKNPPSLDD